MRTPEPARERTPAEVSHIATPVSTNPSTSVASNVLRNPVPLSSAQLADQSRQRVCTLQSGRFTTPTSAISMANRRRSVALEGLIRLDKPLSDLYARNLANELLAADEAEIKARRSLHNRLMRGCRRGSLLRQTRRAICSSKTRSAQFRRTTSPRPLR